MRTVSKDPGAHTVVLADLNERGCGRETHGGGVVEGEEMGQSLERSLGGEPCRVGGGWDRERGSWDVDAAQLVGVTLAPLHTHQTPHHLTCAYIETTSEYYCYTLY